MKDKIVDYLKQLDLSGVEAKLYLTLLQSGPTSVRDLAETVDIKRTTTYFYIDQLVDKGLIMKLVRGSKKLIAANEPKELKRLVEEKTASAKVVQKDFPEILKFLKSSLSQENNTNDAEIKFYKGKAGVKKIYEEALKGNDLRTYVKLEENNSPLPEDIELFKKSLAKNKNLVIKEIFFNSPLVQDRAPQILSNNNRYSFKLLPKDLKLTSGDTLIYNNTVAIINYNTEITSVVLYNNDFYNTLKELFEFIWKSLP